MNWLLLVLVLNGRDFTISAGWLATENACLLRASQEIARDANVVDTWCLHSSKFPNVVPWPVDPKPKKGVAS